MRVGLELTGLELDPGGSAEAAARLRDELHSRPDVEVVPLAHPGEGPNGLLGRFRRGLSRELVYLPVELPRRVRRLELDLLHCPTPLPPLPRSLGGLPLVLTIYDALAWCRPEWLTRANVLQQRLVVAPAARRAACVLTASSYSRRSLVDRLRLDPDRVVVTPLGVDGRFSPGLTPSVLPEKWGISGPYILAAGTLQPRKNLGVALVAFERLVADGAKLSLVVAGGRGWGDRELVERIERSRARACIHLVGRVTDDELVGLYRGATCFVYPSRFEGFGLPPLEAMACGTPVVTSDRASLPEVVGDAALLVDPDDAQDLVQALDRLLTDESLREDLVARGLSRAKGFTWARCAELTVAAYRKALS